jgi:hypothetical protein
LGQTAYFRLALVLGDFSFSRLGKSPLTLGYVILLAFPLEPVLFIRYTLLLNARAMFGKPFVTLCDFNVTQRLQRRVRHLSGDTPNNVVRSIVRFVKIEAHFPPRRQ